MRIESIMHAGVSPDADRRLNCLRSCTPRQAWSEDISLFNPAKKLPHSAAPQFFRKESPFGLILMGSETQKSDKRQRGQKSRLCPPPFEGNVHKQAPRYALGQV